MDKENLIKLFNKYGKEILLPREQIIFKYRFGLEDGKKYTLEEIGKILGVTRERIRQLEGKVISKLEILTKDLTGSDKRV